MKNYFNDVDLYNIVFEDDVVSQHDFIYKYVIEETQDYDYHFADYFIITQYNVIDFLQKIDSNLLSDYLEIDGDMSSRIIESLNGLHNLDSMISLPPSKFAQILDTLFDHDDDEAMNLKIKLSIRVPYILYKQFHKFYKVKDVDHAQHENILKMIVKFSNTYRKHDAIKDKFSTYVFTDIKQALKTVRRKFDAKRYKIEFKNAKSW